MAGLGHLTSASDVSTTELPSWYSTAQQNVANLGQAGAQNVPAFQNTVGQLAVNQLQDPNNAFARASSNLQDISHSASNPFLASGEYNPDSQLGRLFASQRRQLEQQIPYIDALNTARATGSGAFGSNRALEAGYNARARALADLDASQNQSALSALQQATTANTALGNVANQQQTQEQNLAQLQQTAPLAGASGLSKILGGLGNVGSKVTDTAHLSPLAQAKNLFDVLGSPGAGALAKSLGLDPSSASKLVSGIWGGLQRGFGGGANPAGGSSRTFPLQGGGTLTMNADGTQTIVDENGIINTYDEKGNLVNSTGSEYTTPDDAQLTQDYANADFGNYGAVDEG